MLQVIYISRFFTSINTFNIINNRQANLQTPKKPKIYSIKEPTLQIISIICLDL